MEGNITFKMQFTFPKVSVLAFAKSPIDQGGLGYSETVPVFNSEGAPIVVGTAPNPEDVFDFIARLAKEHNEKFVTRWADYLANAQLQKQIEVIKPQIDTTIIKPVIDAIQVSYE